MKSNDKNTRSSSTDLIEGDAKIVSGKIKEDLGKLVRSAELAAKGNAEMIEGRVQKEIGELKKALKDS